MAFKKYAPVRPGSPKQFDAEARYAGHRKSIIGRVYGIARSAFRYPKSWDAYMKMLVHCDMWVEHIVPADMTIYAPVVMQTPGVKAFFERAVVESLGVGQLIFVWQPTIDVVQIKGLAPVLPDDKTAPPHPLRTAGPHHLLMGKLVSGKPLIWDSAYTPSMIMAGTTRGGKSTGQATIIVGVLLNGDKVFIADPKRTEYREFKRAPRVEVYSSVLGIANMSDRLVIEMESRYDQAAREGLREEDVVKQRKRIYVFFDEWARVVPRSKADDKATQEQRKTIENNVNTIAAMGAAVGMHAVIATQYPRSDVLDTRILVNCDARAVYGRMTSDGSRVVLEKEDAAFLPGIHGRGLFRLPNGNLVEFQGYNTSPQQRSEVTSMLIRQEEAARNRDRQMVSLGLIKGGASDA